MSKKAVSTKFMLALGLPAFGLTYGVTILTAYLPTSLIHLTSPIFIGLIIGAEGFFGLGMPFIFGFLADRVKTVQARLRYLLPATVAMAASLVVMGLFHSLLLIGLLVALFYMGYFAYLAPYWALYLDVIPKHQSGQSRSAEGIWRVVGSMAALISGGFLLEVWRPAPFVLAAALVGLVTFALSLIIEPYRKQPIKHNNDSFRESLNQVVYTLKHNADIRRLAIANTCWNATLQAIQAFVVLYFVVGLGRSNDFVSGLIFPIAAIGLLGMAPFAGRLADRFGYVRTLTISAVVYGFGALLPTVTNSSFIILIVPVVAAAATASMVLPYALLMRMLGDADRHHHGAMSGLFGFSRGVGSFLGPLLAGIAITFSRSIFPSTKGYAAYWAVAGGFGILSIFFIIRIPEPVV